MTDEKIIRSIGSEAPILAEGVPSKDAGTLAVEFTPAGGSAVKRLERRLTDAGWTRR